MNEIPFSEEVAQDLVSHFVDPDNLIREDMIDMSAIAIAAFLKAAEEASWVPGWMTQWRDYDCPKVRGEGYCDCQDYDVDDMYIVPKPVRHDS